MQAPALLGEIPATRPEMFYDLRHATVFCALRALHQARTVIDLTTLQAHLKKIKQLEPIGGPACLASLLDAAPSAANWSYYLDILREKHVLRQTIRVCTESAARCQEWEGTIEELTTGIRADLENATALGARDQKPALQIWTVDRLKEWQPPEHLKLIGDNEISMGYEGLFLIAGPGSSGKSLLSATIGLAGALGRGQWQGRQVHRRFKTLILQAENGAVRLKHELQTMDTNHPEARINDWVFVSEPPEGGLPFHRPEFRSAVREQIHDLKIDLAILDPWSQVAAEDSAKDVVDKLAEIRSCFPAGENCPGLGIIAHTKKPRPEDVRRGRALAYLVAGSVALVNTARCVYMLLPWSEELTDQRVYFACPKLNNGSMYAPSVWARKFGTFFEPDPDTDPAEWGLEREEEPEHRAILLEDLTAAFGTEHVLTKADLARRLVKRLGIGQSTVFHAITPGPRGYLAEHLEITPQKWLKLRLEETADKAKRNGQI